MRIMNDLQIEYFLAVASKQSFKKVADERFVSQPAISKQIALLEEELGVTLFTRGRKSTHLTEAGRTVADYIHRQRAELQTVVQLAQNIQKKGSAYLRVYTGAIWTLEDVLSQAIAKILSVYPEAHFVIENHPFENLGSLLNDDNADVIIGMSHAIRSTQSIEVVPFVSIRRLIAYSHNHILASRRKLAPIDFKDETFFYPVMYEKTFVKTLIKNCFESYGFIPKFQAVSNESSMLSCVINGFGIAMIDTWVLAAYKQSLKAIPLDSFHEVSIAWKKDNSNPVLKKFIDSIFDISSFKFG